MKDWGYLEGLSILDLGVNTYLFNFEDAKIPQWILDEEAMWNVIWSFY